jgi:HK97 family phage major capsid protein
MCRLATTSGGTLQTIGCRPAFNGRPVIFSQSLPASGADNSTKIMLRFGDLSLSSILGTRRGITLARSDQRYLELDLFLVII